MSPFGKNILITAALVMALFPVAGFAAVTIPGTADPSRVQEQIAPPPPQTQPEVKTAAPSITPEQAPPGADQISFVLKAVQIEGMTAYKEADVARLYQKMLEQKISLMDVYNLANQLTARYRNDGYILSQVIIPPQTIDGGIIKLQVIEGYIDEVHIQNKGQGDRPTFYAAYGDLIKQSKPLNEKVLEKYMLLINDLPGVSAKSVLSPSPKTPGASDLTIIIEHKLVDASAGTDNRGSLYIGAQQFNASTRINDALGQNEGITLQGATAPGDMNSGTVSVSRPLGYLGTTLNLSGSVTTTNPGYTLAQFDIRGVTHEFIAGVTYPFIRSRSENFSGTAKFDYFDTDRADNLGGPTIEDRLRVLRLSLFYQNSDRFQGANSLTTELSKGLGIFDSSRVGDANMTRAGGDPLFTKVTFEATRLQRLTDTFQLYAAATGQKSADNLLSSEEFGVGGANYGSAYDSSEITGLNGLAGRAELRASDPRLHAFQPYTFYDIGKVWDPDNSDAKSRISSVASAGFGLRANFFNKVTGSLEFAAPLTKDIEAGHSMQPRVFSSLTAKF